MIEYHEEVFPYLNTNPELDLKVFALLSHWDNRPDIEIDAALKHLQEAVLLSPNIQDREAFLKHCPIVSKQCGYIGQKINQNYPFLDEILIPTEMEFMGLIEDFMYLIGGDGSNNPNAEDSNPYHEILTLLQFEHMGYEDLANSVALHFVSHEILEEEHEKDRFRNVKIPDKLNLNLDILTAVDALCTTEFLPDKFETMQGALHYRLEEITKRRGPNHLLTRAVNPYGAKRLSSVVTRIESLMRGAYSNDYVRDIYNLNE